MTSPSWWSRKESEGLSLMLSHWVTLDFCRYRQDCLQSQPQTQAGLGKEPTDKVVTHARNSACPSVLGQRPWDVQQCLIPSSPGKDMVSCQTPGSWKSGSFYNTGFPQVQGPRLLEGTLEMSRGLVGQGWRKGS